MTQTPRADLLWAIAELSKRYPNWRFGQLVANVASWVDADLWEVEDGQFLMVIRNHLAGATPPSGVTADQPTVSV
jgi:hypothetical protein